MIKITSRWALHVIFAVLSFVSIAGANADGPVTINNVDLGQLLMGEPLSKEDLKESVVAIEYFVCACKGCVQKRPQIMTRLLDWHKKYSAKGLIIILFTEDKTKDDILAYAKANKLPFQIYNNGSISGLDLSEGANFVLFDHKGNMVHAGKSLVFDTVLEDAVNRAPDPLIGQGVYQKLGKLVQEIKKHKDLGQILTTLKTKYLNSADVDEVTEAQELIRRLTGFGNKSISMADRKRDSEPLAAYNLYLETAGLFKGDAIGDNAGRIVKELNQDKTFQDNMKADKDLAEITTEMDGFKTCNRCKIFNKDCDACRKRNPSFDKVVQKGKALIKKYPASPAAGKVKQILPVE
jgi:hypothetical protein